MNGKVRRLFVYIVHPYRNDPEGNRLKVKCICRRLVSQHPDVVPIAPQLILKDIMEDDCAPDAQLLAFELCRSLMLRCNEVWVYGDTSEGCQEDIAYAIASRLPVILKC